MADHDTHDHTGVTGVPSSTAPNPTTIELGHASDTTLSRASAGVVAVEGVNLVKAGAATSSGLTMATARLLGRTTASTGAIEEITVGSGLTLSGGSLSASGGGGSSDPFGWGFPMTADPGYAAATGFTIGNGVCRYMRVIGGGAITKVGMYVVASSGNICVAHYSPSGSGRSAVPGTRVATSGAVASPGTGYREISLSTTLAAGDFLAISADNGTFSILTVGNTSAFASAIAAGRNYAQASSGHPCPSPAGTLDAGNPITYLLVGVA